MAPTYERVWERAQAPKPQRRRPKVTYILLAVIAVVYVIQVVVYAVDAFWHNYVFTVGTDWYYARPWGPITSTFSHSPTQISHVLFNGLFLYFFGTTVEQIIGWRRFVALFVATGALSGIIQVHLSAAVTGVSVPALGASGALMAILGVMVMLMPKARVMIFFPLPLPMPLWLMGAAYAFLDVVGVFNPYDGVGNFAHLSGLAVGLVYGMQVRAALKRRGLRLSYQ